MYQYLKSFPQRDRYSLGQKIENFTLLTFESVILASTNQGEAKLPFIEKAIAYTNLIKILIRLAKDINILKMDRYLQLEKSLLEIGRMLGGWKKSLK